MGIGLAGLAATGYKADALTEALVWYLAAVQENDGCWRCDDFRPPLEDGRVPAVALALHALQLYPYLPCLTRWIDLRPEPRR
jgi:hypothetical protein